MAVGGSGHGWGTNLDPTNDYELHLDDHSACLVARAVLTCKKNDLSTTIPAAPGTDTLYAMIWDFQPDVAGQMVYQCVNDPTYRANGGVAAGSGDYAPRINR